MKAHSDTSLAFTQAIYRDTSRLLSALMISGDSILETSFGKLTLKFELIPNKILS